MTMVTTGPEMPGPELNGEHPGPCSFLRRFPSSYHPRSPQIYLPDDHVSNESVRHAILPLVSSFPTINSAGNNARPPNRPVADGLRSTGTKRRTTRAHPPRKTRGTRPGLLLGSAGACLPLE